MVHAREAFAEELRRARTAAGLSLAQLAAAVHAHRGYLGHVEAGERWPSEPVARLLDDALGARGRLLACWRRGDAEAREAAEQTRAVAASARESRRFAELLDGSPGQAADEVLATAGRLGVDYLRRPPAPMLHAALSARGAVAEQLHRVHREAHRRELVRAAGYLSGVLAYAALDLGHPTAAAEHTAAGWRCAEHTGDAALAAWTRGTQSLIARFRQDYRTAADLAADGLSYAGAGTSRPRLQAGVAQSAANLGDRVGAHRALDTAEAAAENAGSDELGGLFTFSRAKLAYYGGSALIWLDQPADALRASSSATNALTLWAAGDPADRSLDDEALAHVYAATAHVQLGELDQAAADLAPVLALPAERRISWLVKRTARISELLAAPRFAGSAAAADLREAAVAFAAH